MYLPAAIHTLRSRAPNTEVVHANSALGRAARLYPVANRHLYGQKDFRRPIRQLLYYPAASEVNETLSF